MVGVTRIVTISVSVRLRLSVTVSAMLQLITLDAFVVSMLADPEGPVLTVGVTPVNATSVALGQESTQPYVQGVLVQELVEASTGTVVVPLLGAVTL